MWSATINQIPRLLASREILPTKYGMGQFVKHDSGLIQLATHSVKVAWVDTEGFETKITLNTITILVGLFSVVTYTFILPHVTVFASSKAGL